MRKVECLQRLAAWAKLLEHLKQEAEEQGKLLSPRHKYLTDYQSGMLVQIERIRTWLCAEEFKGHNLVWAHRPFSPYSNSATDELVCSRCGHREQNWLKDSFGDVFHYNGEIWEQQPNTFKDKVLQEAQ